MILGSCQRFPAIGTKVLTCDTSTSELLAPLDSWHNCQYLCLKMSNTYLSLTAVLSISITEDLDQN